jgi:hypothetical protein
VFLRDVEYHTMTKTREIKNKNKERDLDKLKYTNKMNIKEVGYARGGGLRSLRIGCNGVNIVQ